MCLCVRACAYGHKLLTRQPCQGLGPHRHAVSTMPSPSTANRIAPNHGSEGIDSPLVMALPLFSGLWLNV